MSDFIKEVEKRRTFAIISHPDAGKTTLTEKFLLYGGAIQQAGTVKGKKNSRHATSDWMEIEKQRGISVTSSVLQFNYDGFCINILDTPGHQDFSEDTYRTLMAADCAVMVIDASKGVEDQTRKLFKVCTMRNIPIFTFINKMDREAQDPYNLMEEIEQELGIDTCPVNWPIGSGKQFKGVYERHDQEVIRFIPVDGGRKEVHVRPACPPIMFGCKYLNFSRSSSELDLVTRRVIQKLEGDNVSDEILKEYADPDSERYKNMCEEIRRRSKFTSLRYHRLDDMIESIGLDKCKLCTYCWDGKEDEDC